MAGITHLSDFLSKKGLDFITSILSREVIITEKIDGSNFNVEKTKNGLVFYKRDAKTPISEVDRLLSVYYEPAIQHFENLPAEAIDKIPVGTFISLEWFANTNPVTIAYSKKPKNGLILEFIKKPNGKIVYDKKELDAMADLLQVQRPPIIYQGKLNDTQKRKLLKFIETPFEKLVETYKTKSFSRFIIGMLNPNLKSSFLQDSLDDMIEGVVFIFKGDEDEPILAKIVDPLFTHAAKEKAKENRGKPNDIYGMIVSDITDFISKTPFENEVKNTIPKSNDFAKQYIYLMSYLFLKYFSKHGDSYTNMDLQIPKFLDKKEFAINYRKIPFPEISKIVKSNKNYLELYRIFLAAFKKKKLKAVGYFTKDFIKFFNSQVERIQNFISSTLSESELYSDVDIKTFAVNEDFNLYYNEYLASYLLEELDEDAQDLNMLALYNSLEPKLNEELSIIKDKGAKLVNIVVGRFQPFHNGHLAVGKFLHEANGYKVVYLYVKGKNPNVKSPLSVETLEKVFKSLKDEYSFIEAAFRIKTAAINEVFNKLRENGYEPVLWGAGDDRTDGYEKQLERYKDEIEPVDGFEITNIPRNLVKVSATMVREAIAKGNEDAYKKMVPKPLHKFFKDLEVEMIDTIEVSKDKNLKIPKNLLNGIYSMDIADDKTIIKFNPAIKDSIIKYLKK